MSNVAYGFRGFFGFGEESTYGTPVAATNFLEINQESLAKMVAQVESASLYRRGINDANVVSGGVGVSGDFEFDARYDGWMKLAKHAFGNVATDQPDAMGAPATYRHKFTIADTLPAGLTMEVFRDSTDFGSPDTNKSFIYQGCKISGMEIGAQVGEVMKVKCGVIGQDEANGNKTSSPTFPSKQLAVYREGVIEWDGSDIEVSQFSLNINNNLNGRPKLGSALTREPIPDGHVEVTGHFTMELKDMAMYRQFVASTRKVFRADFTGPVSEGSVHYSIALVCNVALLHNWKSNLNTVGRLMVEADFKAYRNATYNELELTFVNQSTSP